MTSRFKKWKKNVYLFLFDPFVESIDVWDLQVKVLNLFSQHYDFSLSLSIDLTLTILSLKYRLDQTVQEQPCTQNFRAS